MALIKCIECGNDVSSLAPACPKCGAPIPKELPTQFETPGAAHDSPSQSLHATIQRITLKLPNKKPVFKEPFTMGTGLGGGLFIGILMLLLWVMFGGGLLFVVVYPFLALIPIVVCMVIGALIASSDKGKPPEEKAQSIDIPYLCPYCKKTVSYSHRGPVTSLADDVKSLKCSVCGNTSIIDWDFSISIQNDFIDNSAHVNTVKIMGPTDSKKFYLVAREFCKDFGLSFQKTKEDLLKGADCRFENKDEALKIIEKYTKIGCRVYFEKH